MTLVTSRWEEGAVWMKDEEEIVRLLLSPFFLSWRTKDVPNWTIA